jgi:hypothetical protein
MSTLNTKAELKNGGRPQLIATLSRRLGFLPSTQHCFSLSTLTKSAISPKTHRPLLEADNFDRASRSLKTDIKFSKKVRLPKD